MESKTRKIRDGFLALLRALSCMVASLIVGLQLLASAVLFAFPSAAGEASAMLNLPKDKTNTTMVKRVKEEKREMPQLAPPPKAHDLFAVVSREKGEMPQLAPPPKARDLLAVVSREKGGMPQLVPPPKAHDLLGVVSREKGEMPQLAPPPKAHDLLAVVSRANKHIKKSVNKANLSGCWDDYTRHGSTETHEVVTVEQQDSAIQIKTRKSTYRGQLNGVSLRAEYQPGTIEDMMGKWWSDDGKLMASPSRGSLSQAVKILGHMPVYAYELTAADRDHMSGTFIGLHLVWDGQKMKNVTSAGPVQWPERMVRRTGRMQSLYITGPNGKAISSVGQGGQIRIEAKLESDCKVGLQSALVHVYPGHEKDIGMDVTLIETAPGSGVLRSIPLTIHPGWSGDAVRATADGGLRGTKVVLNTVRVLKNPAPKVLMTKSDANSEAKPVTKQVTSLPEKAVKQPTAQPGTISVNGGSRKLHADLPVKAKPVKQAAPATQVKWTAYKLIVNAHDNHLPTMDVLKLSFQKGSSRAGFRVMRYPVSITRNDQTGKVLWSINWSSGDVVENEMAIQPDMISALETMANDKSKGGVEKNALAGRINSRLGPDAQQK